MLKMNSELQIDNINYLRFMEEQEQGNDNENQRAIWKQSRSGTTENRQLKK